MRKLLGSRSAKCHSVNETFSRPSILSERFATSSTYQYYQYAPINSRVGEVFLRKICGTKPTALESCESQMQELARVNSIDIDFDVISHSLILSAFWPASDTDKDSLIARRAARAVQKPRAQDRVEVGVLQVENATEPEEMSLGGYLTIIGEDDHPGTTQDHLFSVNPG